MRKVVVILAVLAMAFAAYWFAVARGVERGLAAWFAARTADGWVAEYADLSTEGFPGEFRTVLGDVTLADPRTGVAWTAPRFEIRAAAFRPHHITAIWPAEHSLATPWDRTDIAADRFEASLEFVPGTRLEVRAVEADLGDVALASTAGWRTGFAVGRLSAALAPERPNTYAVRFEATGLSLPGDLRRRLDPAGLLPDVVEGLVTEATVAFDRRWDRFAIEMARPQPLSVDLSELRAQWGGIELRAAGEVAVLSGGIPDGRITLKITNWRDLLAIGRNAGLLPEALMPTIERAFEILAGLSGPADTLDVPLTFANGFVSFGPVPLGPAPRLVIR